MFGGATVRIPAKRRRLLLLAAVIAFNAPIVVHTMFPRLVGLTHGHHVDAMQLVVASPQPPDASGCAHASGRAPIRSYLTGKVCAPPGFPYKPVLRQTENGPRMMDPQGACTSAIGDSGRSFDFAAACHTHDYGYDLLRFFGVGGAERKVVDAMLGQALWNECRGRSALTRFNCYGWAATFDGLNRFNAILRDYEVPRGPIGNNVISDLSTKAVQVGVVADIGIVAALLRLRRRRAPQPAIAFA